MISFRSIGKTYPDGTRAVSDISLDIASGKLTVFIGPSGCGKTTCLRMINRMVEPTTGVITINGENIATTHAARLRRRIGYVIQNVGLFPHRTILDNIATVPVLEGMSRRSARHAASELLERVGLEQVVGRRYPAQLSGGQQQRVGVARALAADPPILLMDEPFSAVDPVVRTQLQNEMLRLQAELGKTVVFVTHDLDEALRLGEQLAIFAPGGRLAQVAEPASILATPADDFVAEFIGHDRGYRALSFADAGPLPIQPAATISIDRVRGALAGKDTSYDVSLAQQLRQIAPARWYLLVDDDRRPHGWLDGGPILAGAKIEPGNVRLGGSLIRPGGSLREALDAALSSPSAAGVAIDDSGAVVGTVTASAVLAAIEQARSAAADAAGPVVAFADRGRAGT